MTSKSNTSVEVAPFSSWIAPLLPGEAVRAALCMLPMAIAYATGNVSLMVPLGQGGFYYAALALAPKRGARLLSASLLIALGLGFYLMGGNVSTNLWLTVFFSFLVGLNLVVLTSWDILGLSALSFVTVYSAGLNTGDPTKAHTYFFAFILSIGWGAFVSMLPIWKGQIMPKPDKPTNEQVITTGFRMGMGMALAVFVAGLFGFSKLGWAPSGVANSVRFDWETSKKRGFLRELGTVIGAGLVIIVLLLTVNLTYLAIFSFVFAVLNGLFKMTKIGAMPLFYTATILLIYSLNDIAMGPELAIERIIYNLVGVLIALLVVWYPFPYVFKNIKATLRQNAIDQNVG